MDSPVKKACDEKMDLQHVNDMNVCSQEVSESDFSKSCPEQLNSNLLFGHEGDIRSSVDFCGALESSSDVAQIVCTSADQDCEQRSKSKDSPCGMPKGGRGKSEDNDGSFANDVITDFPSDKNATLGNESGQNNELTIDENSSVHCVISISESVEGLHKHSVTARNGNDHSSIDTMILTESHNDVLEKVDSPSNLVCAIECTDDQQLCRMTVNPAALDEEVETIHDPLNKKCEMDFDSMSDSEFAHQESKTRDFPKDCSSSLTSVAKNGPKENSSTPLSLIEVVDKNQNDDALSKYRGSVVPYSDSEDDDSSSSSSSYESSSDDSDALESDDAADNEEELKSPKVGVQNLLPKPIKAQGELDLGDLPPIQDLHISVPNDQVAEIGKILHIVDLLVVVECYKDQPPLDIDSVLFLDCGARPLGRIFDVMGPVTEPLYCVRFNSKTHIEEHNVVPGMLVYCAPQTEHSNFVFVKKLIMMKGSDASWKRDKEVPISEVDFSDDEAETKKKHLDKDLRNVSKPKRADEPQPKLCKMERQQSIPRSHPSAPRFSEGPGNKQRAWSGQRCSFPSRTPQHSEVPNPNNWFYSQRSQRMPSSLNPDYQTPFSRQNIASSSVPRHHASSPNAMFGSRPDPRNFGQPSRNFNHLSQDYAQHSRNFSQPPRNIRQPSHTAWSNYNSTSWQSNDEYSPVMNQGSGNFHYSPNNPSHAFNRQGSSNQSHENHRYNAFQSEIARLVQAYNDGAQSPAALLSPLAHPHGENPPHY